MATKHSLQDNHVLLPLAVLGVLAGIDATFPPETLVSSSYGVAALVACAITTVRITAIFGVAGSGCWPPCRRSGTTASPPWAGGFTCP